VAPAAAGSTTHWRMASPVEAPADEEAVTKAVMGLMNLRADAFITDKIGDGKEYGLDRPALTVTWTIPVESAADRPKANVNAKDKAKAKAKDEGQPVTETETGTLRVGDKLPKGDLWYA